MVIRRDILFGFQVAALAVFFALNTGAILKKENNSMKISMSDPISFDEKMEQEKDGVKAPAATTIEYYGGKGFFEATPHDTRDFDEEVEKSKSAEEDFLDWWDSFESADTKVEESADAGDSGTTDDVFDDFLDETKEQNEFDDDFWW